MNAKSKQEILGVIVTWIIMACAVVVIPILVTEASNSKRNQESVFEKYLTENQCKPFSTDSTGNKIYCGKACFRDEIRYDYICKDDKHIIRME